MHKCKEHVKIVCELMCFIQGWPCAAKRKPICCGAKAPNSWITRGASLHLPSKIVTPILLQNIKCLLELPCYAVCWGASVLPQCEGMAKEVWCCREKLWVLPCNMTGLLFTSIWKYSITRRYFFLQILFILSWRFKWNSILMIEDRRYNTSYNIPL